MSEHVRKIAVGQETLRTCDVGIENVIFSDDIVDQLLAVLVEHEYLPLLVGSASGGLRGLETCIRRRGWWTLWC